MAMYVYRRADGELLDIEHPMSQEPLTECPDTGLAVIRVPQAFGSRATFGSDFYKDAKRAALDKPPPAAS